MALLGCGDGAAPDRALSAPTYVGRAACAECHADQERLWSGSDHDLAMAEMGTSSVRGDFGAPPFQYRGVTTTFSRTGEAYTVETEGPDGATATFDLAYTFGVRPLQQYLVPFPDGRMQALSVAWDARPAQEGGQRWFHTYPDQDIPPGDVLHWTGPSQNWNYMCAECHSTGLEKGYDLEADTYATTWSEVDVSCEACHGPGSAHVAWAREGASESDPGAARANGSGRYGLTAEVGDPARGSWVMDPETGVAVRNARPDGSRQLDTCGRCHSRRSTLASNPPAGLPLLDTHLPSILERDLYHPDGQILDEVYVWGSFVQSAMYRAGVRCSDCHDPHSLDLKAPGNGVCASCHLASRFDTPEHHRHPAESEGARCVECHMPARTYMVVDPRRDHSMRVPRPDLSAELGTPDACTSCHQDRTPRWAADRVAEWHGTEQRDTPHYGQVIHAGRLGAPGADTALARLVTTRDVPAIVRATAVTLLAERPGPVFGAVLPLALQDPDPQVRAMAVRSLDVVPVEHRLRLAGPLLNDAALAVRTQAARVLAVLHREPLPPGQVRILDRATRELEEALAVTADHPSAHVSSSRLRADLGDPVAAEAALRTALQVGPWFVPAWINLADLYRSLDRDEEGEAVLLEAVGEMPDQASIHYALGLLYSRTDRAEQALAELETAARLAPEGVQFTYAYALALNGADRGDEALDVLATALEGAPYEPDLLFALATIHRDQGQLDRALTYARRMLELSPDDPNVQGFVQELEGQGP